ncbi:hypothetical protein [Vibrio owensii]|uniref:hypothetical protein n=1 Tax=Vibrio owensii TaxID=696485 RepID=UPI0038CF074C
MKRHTLSQKYIAKICSVKQQAVSYWVNSGSMKEEHVETLCEKYNEEVPRFSVVDPLLYDWHPIALEIVKDLMKDSNTLNYADIDPKRREAIEKKLNYLLGNINQFNDLID